MTALWGEQKRRWLAADLDTGTRFRADVAARMFLFYAWQRTQLVNWHEVGGCERVAVASVPDSRCCPECRSIANSEYPITEAVELPYERCVGEVGCRCMIPLPPSRGSRGKIESRSNDTPHLNEEEHTTRRVKTA